MDAGLKAGTVSLADVAAGKDRVATLLAEARAGGVKAVVCDACSDADMSVVAEAAASITPAPVLVGSAGLAAAVPRAFGLQGDVHKDGAGVWEAGEGAPVVVVV